MGTKMPQKEQGVLELAFLILLLSNLSGPLQPQENFVRCNWCCLLGMKEDLFLERPEQGGGYNEYCCLFYRL